MGMEREPETIAMAPTVDLLCIGVQIREEGIVARRAAIGRIHPQDLASQGGQVRPRSLPQRYTACHRGRNG